MMIARTCTCGTPIVCADLYGWDVWLDQQPSRDGMYTITAGQAVIDTDGRHRRHVCQHAPGPADDTSPASPAQLRVLADMRDELIRRADQRDIAAAQSVLDAGAPISRFQQQVAALRVQHPQLSRTELAALAGVRPGPYRSALFRVRQAAHQLTSTNQAA